MTKKIFTFILLFILLLLPHIFCNTAFCMQEVARVEIIRDYDDFFHITDGNNVEIGKFRVELLGNVIKNLDGTISFDIKLKDITFPNEILYNNQKIESVDDAKIVTLSIPHNEIQNEIFGYNVRFSSDNLSAIFDEIKFRIIPEVSLTSDIRDVNFGVVTYENGEIHGNPQQVQLSYSILKDAHLEISSENMFRMKQTNGDDYISYTIQVNSGELVDLQQNTKTATLDNRNTSVTITFDPSGICRSMPKAGDYIDSVTVTLTSN